MTECLTKLESDDEKIRAAGKLELVARTSELMPKGEPNFGEVRYYPSIEQLTARAGRKNMLKVLLLMIKDFCDSMNVVRNMDIGQMTECAGMLLDEAGNFRLEDYVMMFALGKRGRLVKIMDRVDIETVGKMIDAYWQYRDQQGKILQEREQKAYDKAVSSAEISPEILAKWKDAIKEMERDLTAENEAEFQKRRERVQQSYATLMGVDMDAVREEFVKPKKAS